MRSATRCSSRRDSSTPNRPQESASPMITTSRGAGITSLNSTSMMRSFTSRSASPSTIG